MKNVNRNHKNSVFSSLFSTPDVLRELYSAIEGIPIPPDIPIDINTLSNVLVMKQINDVSFLLDKRLIVLIEHQSTINENIPYRLLEYTSKIYEKIIDKEKKYQKNIVKIPKPEFIVLYNGVEPYPDYSELKLSDAFMDIEGLKSIIDKIPLELIAPVYNINHGHNTEILRKCESLNGYSLFIGKIREYQAKGLTLEESIDPVIEYCIKNNILKEYLEAHASEVVNMIFGEYDREMDIAVNRREAREEGIGVGLAQGRNEANLENARKMKADNMPVSHISKYTGLSTETINQL